MPGGSAGVQQRGLLLKSMWSIIASQNPINNSAKYIQLDIEDVERCDMAKYQTELTLFTEEDVARNKVSDNVMMLSQPPGEGD